MLYLTLYLTIDVLLLSHAKVEKNLPVGLQDLSDKIILQTGMKPQIQWASVTQLKKI